jgi:S1-C subfamily serine protease
LAQVVWTSGDAADLALLRTSHRISAPFDLADIDAIGDGDPVGATGWSGLSEGGAFDGMAAGKIGSISRRRARGADTFRWQRVEHDVPLQPGDSGGPLIDARGQLVGINSGGKVGAIAIYEPKPEGAPLRGFKAISNLPDREWMMRRIEQDRQQGR